MEILAPQLLWIGGRCYRVNPVAHNSDDEIMHTKEQYIEEGIFFD